MSAFFKEYILPPGLMSALIIGAGIFSLPYIFDRAGILLGFLYLINSSLILSILHLMYAEVIESVSGEHRFVGYARAYFGKKGFYSSFVTTFIGIVFALLIYLVLSMGFVKAIFPSIPDDLAVLIFWIIGTIPILFGIKKIADLSFMATILMMGAIVAIFIYGVGNVDPSSIKRIDKQYLYLPYAAVLFSLYGRAAISSIRLYLQDNKIFSKSRLNYAVVLGTIIPAALYALFSIGVIGLSKEGVSIDSITGLLSNNGLFITAIAVLGLLSLWTSYVFLGMEFLWIAKSDLNLGRYLPGILTAVLPISLYLGGLNNLLGLIAIAGGVLVAIESAFVIAMWLKIKKRKPAIYIPSFILIFVFVIGAIYEIFLNI